MTPPIVPPSDHRPDRPIDVTAWVGAYPFRELPHPDARVLRRVLDREGYGGAWVAHLPGAFHRDPAPSNAALLREIDGHRDVLHPCPIVRPDWPRWETVLREAVAEGAPAVRAYPAQWSMSGASPALAELALACGELGVVLHVTTRFEDMRQRHAHDVAGDVAAATLRGIARAPGSRCQLVVAGAGRELIEEVYWGLTPGEQQRLTFDFAWVWGPPEDHFPHLVRTIGADHFAWSTHWPLRLAQQSRALVDLLPDLERGQSPDHAFADGRSLARAARAA